MQTTGYGTARAVLTVVAAGLALLVFCSSLQAEEDQTLLRRVFQIGVTEEVHAKAAESISPHSGRLQLDSFEEAEFAKPPPPCGFSIYRRFASSVKEYFKVSTLGTCKTSSIEVDCPTIYLPGYSRVYLVLSYQYIAAKEMRIAIEAKKRGAEGQVSPGISALSQKDKLAFTAIFDALLDEAMCQRKTQ